MKKRYFSSKGIFLAVSFFFLSIGAIFPEILRAEQVSDSFAALKKKLQDEGFDSGRIDSIFQKPGVQFDPRTASLFFIHSETRINYDQFLSPESIQNAKKYIRDNISYLDNAEKTLGVNKEIVTAIILVETRLGSYLGKSSTLNTLSSLAAAGEPELREIVWNSISAERRPERSAFEKRVENKSVWAFTELKAFLKYTEREKLDPTTINGSYAGAIGIAQFMPTSILAYAVDGSKDGRIDLFDHADSIMSIANYLKQFGWKPGISYEKAFNVVYKYNHSNYYVKTILKIADILKG